MEEILARAEAAERERDAAMNKAAALDWWFAQNNASVVCDVNDQYFVTIDRERVTERFPSKVEAVLSAAKEDQQHERTECRRSYAVFQLWNR